MPPDDAIESESGIIMMTQWQIAMHRRRAWGDTQKTLSRNRSDLKICIYNDFRPSNGKDMRNEECNRIALRKWTFLVQEQDKLNQIESNRDTSLGKSGSDWYSCWPWFSQIRALTRSFTLSDHHPSHPAYPEVFWQFSILQPINVPRICFSQSREQTALHTRSCSNIWMDLADAHSSYGDFSLCHQNLGWFPHGITLSQELNRIRLSRSQSNGTPDETRSEISQCFRMLNRAIFLEHSLHWFQGQSRDFRSLFRMRFGLSSKQSWKSKYRRVWRTSSNENTVPLRQFRPIHIVLP